MKQLKATLNDKFFNYKQNLDIVEEFLGEIKYSSETKELEIPDNWVYTYSGLIWPLAITYLIASSGYEKIEKYDNLIRLFEFTVAFNSYVLMSGLPEEIYKEEKSNILKIAYTSENKKKVLKDKLPLGFGNWEYFHGTLAGIYKNKFNTKINKEFYIELLNKKIRNIYKELATERNNYFHGSLKNAKEAEIRLKKLDQPKSIIFDYLNSCYKNFRLYYILGEDPKAKIEDGKPVFVHKIMYLNGPYSMPLYHHISSNEILEQESLYLHDLVENKFTKIDDRLIKFKSIDENERDWRLYIFIGFEKHDGKKQAKYRCYQRPEEDIYEDIDLNELM